MENTNNNTNTNKGMENNNKTMSDIFAEMDNAVNTFFNAADNFVAEIKKKEEEKMVFVITRTAHYGGDFLQGVQVVECWDFDSLAEYGVENKSFARAKFPHNHGRNYKPLNEMSVGTILKPNKGEYIQRIK